MKRHMRLTVVCSVIAVASTAEAQQVVPIPISGKDTSRLRMMGGASLAGSQADEAVRNPSARGAGIIQFTPNSTMYFGYNTGANDTAIPASQFVASNVLFPDLSRKGFLAGFAAAKITSEPSSLVITNHGAFAEVAMQHQQLDRGTEVLGFDILSLNLGYRYRYESYSTSNRFRVTAGLAGIGYAPAGGKSKVNFESVLTDRNASSSYLGGTGKFVLQVNDITAIEVDCRYLRRRGVDAALGGAYCVFGPGITGTFLAVQ